MNFEEQSAKSMGELLNPFKAAFVRYWNTAWAPALVVASLVVVLSLRIPDYFTSDFLIFIQPQKVSTKIIDSPRKDEEGERFEALIQELLSRPRLLSIIEKHELYPDMTGVMGKELALQKFRASYSIEPLTSLSGKPVNQTFRVFFTHENPQLAYEVTKAISNLFIEESIITQRSETRGTEEFLDSQLRSARQRLEETETKVQEFIRKNNGKLPEHREQGLQRQRNAQAQMLNNSQLISANVARIGYLQQELQVAMREVAPGDINRQTIESESDPEASLAQLERALVVLKSRYSDKHPDVVNTRQRIEMLKQRLKQEGKPTTSRGGAGFTGNSREVRAIRREINELEVQVQTLKAENDNLKAQIEVLDQDVKLMPLKEQELTEIRRDYQNVKESYERLLAAREEAGFQSSLVQSQKSSQFKVIDPPTVPVIPAGPNRILIAVGGLVAGLVVFALIPMLMFFANGALKFRNEVEREIGVAVIGVLPPMLTPQSAALRRRVSATSFIASVLSFFGGTLLILFTV